MSLSLRKKHKLHRFIKELEKIRGRHTELVSVYVPSGYDLNKIIQHLDQEKGTASNIKDATTRKHVIDSLEKAVRHLRVVGRTPENGLALFSGNASEKESKVDIKVWSIEPPEPMNQRLYRCDQTFVLEPLKEMMEVKEVYGLIVVDRREGNIGLLKGSSIQMLHTSTSAVPGKARAGGQCLDPDTLVEIRRGSKKIKDVKIGEEIKALDLIKNKIIFIEVKNKWKVNKEKCKIISVKDCQVVIASDDHTFFKEENDKIVEVLAKNLKKSDNLISVDTKNKLFVREIKKIEEENKELEMIDIETESENFFANGILVHNSAARFGRIREGMAKEFFRRVADVANQEFLNMKNLKGIILGGPGPTKEIFLDQGQLNQQLKDKIIGIKDLGYTGMFGLHELVDKSKDILEKEEVMEEKKLINEFFEKLAKDSDKVAYGEKEVRKALEMGAVEKLIISESINDEVIDELEFKAEEMGTECRIVSIETREGKQIEELGGLAAILRFAMQ